LLRLIGRRMLLAVPLALGAATLVFVLLETAPGDPMDALIGDRPIPADVRERYGQQLALFGNLEVADIEGMEPSKFDDVVHRTLEAGTAGNGRGFVLMPTACPCGRKISQRTLRNYETMARRARDFVIDGGL